MDENQIANPQRKLRKIKRPRMPENQPGSYGVPEKVNLPQTNNHQEYKPEYETENYFDNNGEAENIRFITEEDLAPAESESITVLMRNKTVLMLLGIAAIFGLIIGSTFFSTKETAKRGLEGVVVNTDVPAGRSRCGLVEPHQGCVLYIMNPKNQTVTGKDFFTTAAQWTNRQRYLIETGNMHYSSKQIRPGNIAQINIPPLSNQ